MSQAILKAALLQTISRVQKNPASANAVFHADTQLESGVRCGANVRDFPTMIIDEPPSLGGDDAGPNPAELLLVALGTCQEIMYAAFAAVEGVPLTEVKVKARGVIDLHGMFGLDEAVPAGFQKIRFETQLNSPADEATLKKLVETVERHCPILDTLVRAIDVSGHVVINGRAISNVTVP